MDVEGKENFIRLKATENRSDPQGSMVLWSRHSIAELSNEGWGRIAVEEGLQECRVIEDYPISNARFLIVLS